MSFSDEESPWDGYGTPSRETSEFGADTYEKIRLNKEERKTQAAKVKKLNALKECLLLRKEHLELKAAIALEERLRAEAELERIRQMRLLKRDRRQLLKEQRKVEEARQQTAQEVRRLSAAVQAAEEHALTSEEKLVYHETGVRMDTETAEWLTCPKCGERMGAIEFGCGRKCPECGYVKEV